MLVFKSCFKKIGITASIVHCPYYIVNNSDHSLLAFITNKINHAFLYAYLYFHT